MSSYLGTHFELAEAKNTIEDFWRGLPSIHFVLFADFIYLLPSRFKNCFLLCRNIEKWWEKDKAPKIKIDTNP